MSNPDSSNTADRREDSGRTWLHNLKWFGLGAVFGSSATIAVGLGSGAVNPEDVGISKDSSLGKVLDKEAA